MSWKVIITASAKKQLKKLSKSGFDGVSDIIDQLGIDPFHFSDLVKLSGKDNVWRIRKGSYRIKFELFQKEKAVFIYNIERRTSTTY